MVDIFESIEVSFRVIWTPVEGSLGVNWLLLKSKIDMVVLVDGSIWKSITVNYSQYYVYISISTL